MEIVATAWGDQDSQRNLGDKWHRHLVPFSALSVKGAQGSYAYDLGTTPELAREARRDLHLWQWNIWPTTMAAITEADVAAAQLRAALLLFDDARVVDSIVADGGVGRQLVAATAVVELFDAHARLLSTIAVDVAAFGGHALGARTATACAAAASAGPIRSTATAASTVACLGTASGQQAAEPKSGQHRAMATQHDRLPIASII